MLVSICAHERNRTSTPKNGHQALNLARLPIPPRALENDRDANLAKNSFFSDYSKNLDIANIAYIKAIQNGSRKPAWNLGFYEKTDP